MPRIKLIIATVLLTIWSGLILANQHTYTARDLALTGAFSAQVNDSSSLLVNPAGIAPDPEAIDSIHEIAINSGRADFSDDTITDRASDQFNILYAYTGTQFGIGLGYHDNDNLYFESTLGLPNQNIATEEYIFTLAYAVTDWLKLGGSLRSLYAETRGLAPHESDSSQPNHKVGLQIAPWDFNGNGYLIALRLAATYQSEGRTKPFNTQTSSYKDAKVPLIPASNVIGASLELLKASDDGKSSTSVTLNLEQEERSYSPEIYLLFPTAPSISNQSETLKLSRSATSLELMRSTTQKSYALRLGFSEIAFREDEIWTQKQFGLGLGLIITHWAFDVGLRRSHTERRDENDIQETNLLGSVSYQF